MRAAIPKRRSQETTSNPACRHSGASQTFERGLIGAGPRPPQGSGPGGATSTKTAWRPSFLEQARSLQGCAVGGYRSLTGASKYTGSRIVATSPISLSTRARRGDWCRVSRCSGTRAGGRAAQSTLLEMASESDGRINAGDAALASSRRLIIGSEKSGLHPMGN